MNIRNILLHISKHRENNDNKHYHLVNTEYLAQLPIVLNLTVHYT